MQIQADAGMTSERWSLASAIFGALLWLGAPWVPAGTRPSFGTIEHLFVFLPLVAAPLALALLSTLLAARGASASRAFDLARRLQPAAAVMVLASFFLDVGRVAGALAAGWLVTAILVAIGCAPAPRTARGTDLASASLVAARVFLLVGAVWLLLSRLGVTPPRFASLTVFLAAVHFHASGFMLQVLVAATGRELRASGSRLGALHRCAAIGAIAGIPLIALGNVLSLRILKFTGVSSMVFATIALAPCLAAVALEASSRAARALLLSSAAAIAAAMVLAGVYGVGELTGRGWIGIPRMAELHGLLNALGFTLCGLCGHLLLRRPPISTTSRDGSGGNRRLISWRPYVASHP